MSWAHISYTYNKFFDFLSLCSIPFKYKDEKAKILGEICAKLADFSKDESLALQIKVQSLALDMLYEALKDSASDINYPDNTEYMMPAIEYINRNIARSISVSELAAVMNMSLSTFRRSFTKTFGKSPMFFIIQRKLEIACEKLQYSDMSVSEISYLCGYSDPFYFSRLFKQKLGICPVNYRVMARTSTML